jgi:WASH complex subunit strumpellin
MSVLAEGILMMQITLVGIIRIDPKRLLENGIRKELVSQVCDLLHTTLMFQGKGNSGSREGVLRSKLEHISKRLDGIRRSFEYIGDYVNSNGLKVNLCMIIF